MAELLLDLPELPEIDGAPAPAAPVPTLGGELMPSVQTGGHGDVDLFKGDETVHETATVVKRLQAILDADVRNMFHADGTVKSVQDWPENESLAMASWTYNVNTGLWSFKMADKVRAAETLAKIQGLFARDAAVKHPLVDMLEAIPRDTLNVILKRLQAESGIRS